MPSGSSPSPLKLVKKVIVPAASSMIGGGPLTCPAFEMMTAFPFSGFVAVARNEAVSLKLSFVIEEVVRDDDLDVDGDIAEHVREAFVK